MASLQRHLLFLYPRFPKASSKDFWVRHLLESPDRTVFKNNSGELVINPSYLQDKFKPILERPWSSELSGRMLSLTFKEGKSSDIRERANQVADEQNKRRDNKKLSFRNLAYAYVTEFRSFKKWKFDVYLDPNKEDPAHANLVIFNKIYVNGSSKISHEIFRDLAKIVKVEDATDTSKVDSLIAALSAQIRVEQYEGRTRRSQN